MNKEDILKRIEFLLNPDLENTINNLKVEEINPFINHITMDLRNSIYNFKLIYKLNDEK